VILKKFHNELQWCDSVSPKDDALASHIRVDMAILIGEYFSMERFLWDC